MQDARNSRNGESPRVSIVIPCYNQAEYLAEAIESALGQSYARVEVIVVDDGSTDSTPEIAQSYPTVKYARQSRKGVAEACNTGIRLGSGEFSMFLGGDDRLMPGAAEQHLACFSQHPEAGFVSGDIDLIDSRGTHYASPRSPCTNARYAQLLKVEHVANTIAVMFRRSVFDCVGYFDPEYEAGEDYEMLLRVARSYPGAQHRNVVTQYRRHPSNMTRDGAMMLRSMLSVMRKQQPFLAEDAELKLAWRKGVRHWRHFYGAVTIRQALHLAMDGRFSAAAQVSIVLFKYLRGDLFSLPWSCRRHALRLLQQKLRRRGTPLPAVIREPQATSLIKPKPEACYFPKPSRPQSICAKK